MASFVNRLDIKLLNIVSLLVVRVQRIAGGEVSWQGVELQVESELTV